MGCFSYRLGSDKGVLEQCLRRSSSSNLEEVVKSNPFSIKITKGIPKDTDLKINCFNIEMRGMVNHPTQDEIKVLSQFRT